MQYLANNKYKVNYTTKDGEEKVVDYVPKTNTNIAGVTKEIKSINNDFLKLNNITEVKDVKTEDNNGTEGDVLTTLYDVLEARNFEDVDITDKNIDMMVAFCLDPESGDSDPYDTFLTTLAKQLSVDPISTEQAIKADIITVDMSKWVSDNFDKLDSIFDISGSNKDEAVANMVEMMEAVISGAAKDSTYNALMENKAITESNNTDEEYFEELADYEDVDTTEEQDVVVNSELEGTGEDQTETAEDVSDAIKEVEDEVDDKDVLAVDTSNSSLDVLVADEESAIDGYNSFLNQAKNTLIPALYEVLENEVNEIIADEQDHINKLNTIKANFKFDNLSPVEESKKLNENTSNLKIGDMITIPYARGPKYTDNKSEWVKGKVIDINDNYVDLEVPTTLTVTISQLDKWLSKEESKKLNEIHKDDSDDDNYNIYEKIITYYRNKGLSDDDIAVQILKDTLQISLLDFALDQLNDEQAEEYYNEISEIN